MNHPTEDMYPRAHAAEQRASRDQESFTPYVFVAVAVAVLAILMIALVVVMGDRPARNAVDNACITPPAAVPGPPVVTR